MAAERVPAGAGAQPLTSMRLPAATVAIHSVLAHSCRIVLIETEDALAGHTADLEGSFLGENKCSSMGRRVVVGVDGGGTKTIAVTLDVDTG